MTDSKSEYKDFPFLKKLVSNDRREREESLKVLTSFISGNTEFSLHEFLKLWKGLFYCMWMCDRPKPQQMLADNLASLTYALSEQNLIPFLTAFWKTMQREWTDLDHYRINKFLSLERRFIAAAFTRLNKSQWNVTLVDKIIAIYEKNCLSYNSHEAPDGVRLHVLDIYVEELEKCLAQDKKNESSSIPFEKLLEPLSILSTESPNKTIRKRAKEELLNAAALGWISNPLEKQSQKERKSKTELLLEEDEEDYEEFYGFDD